MAENLLSICFINYNGLNKLKASLSNLVEMIDELSCDIKQCIEVVVSDNRSDNIEKLSEYISSYDRVKLHTTKENTGVDGNIKNCFELASGQYCWIFAVDDYICSKEHLIMLIGVLRNQKPDMLSFNVSLTPKKISSNFITNSAGSVDQNLRFLINSGKISTCIYRRYDCYIRCVSIAAEFSGEGYLHLSYGAALNELGFRHHLFIQEFCVYTLHAEYNHRHEYHPKFSQNSYRAIANNYFMKKSMKVKFIVSYHLLFQLMFVFKIYKNKNFLTWEPILLHDYLYEIGSKVRKSKNIFFLIFYIVIVIKLWLHEDPLELFKDFVGLQKVPVEK